MAFFVCRLQAISCEHARERVRQQAKGARGCAGERKRMSATGREQTQKVLAKDNLVAPFFDVEPVNLVNSDNAC